MAYDAGGSCRLHPCLLVAVALNMTCIVDECRAPRESPSQISGGQDSSRLHWLAGSPAADSSGSEKVCFDVQSCTCLYGPL